MNTESGETVFMPSLEGDCKDAYIGYRHNYRYKDSLTQPTPARS